jgi:hypothetical protein
MIAAADNFFFPTRGASIGSTGTRQFISIEVARRANFLGAY